MTTNSPSGNTAGERLARIEAMIEAKSEHDRDWQIGLKNWQDEVKADLRAIGDRMTGAENAHSTLVNRGAGMLAGVGFLGSVMGAVFYDRVHDLAMWFFGVAK